MKTKKLDKWDRVMIASAVLWVGFATIGITLSQATLDQRLDIPPSSVYLDDIP